MLLVFFPLAFTGICQGELDEIRDNLPDYENDDTADAGDLGGTAADAQGLGHAERFHVPGAVRLLAARRGRPGLRRVQRRRRFRQPRHVRRSTASGIIRFAEMKQPGEARDQSVWTDALTALQSTLMDFRSRVIGV